MRDAEDIKKNRSATGHLFKEHPSPGKPAATWQLPLIPTNGSSAKNGL
jgi:hypothetical protein